MQLKKAKKPLEQTIHLKIYWTQITVW